MWIHSTINTYSHDSNGFVWIVVPVVPHSFRTYLPIHMVLVWWMGFALKSRFLAKVLLEFWYTNQITTTPFLYCLISFHILEYVGMWCVYHPISTRLDTLKKSTWMLNGMPVYCCASCIWFGKPSYQSIFSLSFGFVGMLKSFFVFPHRQHCHWNTFLFIANSVFFFMSWHMHYYIGMRY